jgi:DNA-binding HxlR family transcriptional regulator
MMTDRKTALGSKGNTADFDDCRVVLEVLDRIGDKWTVMVVGTLALGTLRFNALQRSVPVISHRMLTLTLRGLQRDGLVERTAYPTSPPKVEYNLTDFGHSLIGPLKTLSAWAMGNRVKIQLARERFDAESV